MACSAWEDRCDNSFGECVKGNGRTTVHDTSVAQTGTAIAYCLYLFGGAVAYVDLKTAVPD